MKKSLILLAILIITFSSLNGTERVRNLKAYDGSYKKQAITAEQWQNYSNKVLFEWKEPWGDIKEYVYYFGQNKEGLLTKKTTETNFLSKPLTTPGKYYFKIAAVDINNERSDIRTVIVYFDNTPLPNNLSATAYSSKGKEQIIPNNKPQEISNNPYFILNKNKVTVDNADIKGVNIYWGNDPKGVPNTHIKNDSFTPNKQSLANNTYYLRANVEDIAGNISETKTIFTFTYNGTNISQAEKPEMNIIKRSIKIDDKEENKTEAFPGSKITYTIQLNNTGAADAFNVEIKDTIPENTFYLLNSAKSTKPAVIEFWDTLLNGNKGAWTTEIDEQNTNITKIRWAFKDQFKPTQDKNEVQAEISYSVKVKQ